MRLNINRELLLNNLSVLVNGLPSKSPMPSLTGIKIDAVEGAMVLTVSNSDIHLRTTIMEGDFSVEEEGSILVSGKIFVDIVRKVKSKDILLVTVDNVLNLKADRGSYTLNLMDVATYPNIEFEASETPIELDASSLSELIKTCAFATSTSEKKPILTGVNFSSNGGVLNAVATDSFRLAQNKLNTECGDFTPITVPKNSLLTLLKCIGDYKGKLNISFVANKMYVSFGEIEFQSRLLEGNFPDTSRLTTGDFPIKLTFDRDELLEAVERVSLLSPSDSVKDREILYSVIKLNVTPNGVSLTSSSTTLGNASEDVITENELTETDNLVIGFSASYFAEALKAFKSGKIVINLTNNVRPFIITSPTDVNLVQLVLPVRL